jgi:cardiolipin synthase
MYSATTLVIIISGATDVVDGWIARKFQMVSDFGKILDPVSDKLTQAAIVVCLFLRFPHMIYLFALMAVKETIMGVTGLIRIRKSGEVYGADWHGKVNTCLIYAVLLVHIIWHDITMNVSYILLSVVVCVMMLSMVLYVTANIKTIKRGRG